MMADGIDSYDVSQFKILEESADLSLNQGETNSIILTS